MNTKLNKIRECGPCKPSWEKLLASLNKTQADDDPLSFWYLLDTLGIDDAAWCLRTLTYKEQAPILVDLLRLGIPASEKEIRDVFVKHFGDEQ